MTEDDRREASEQPVSGTQPDTLRHLAACLQSSFTAINHDSLGDDITRLLLHLSHVTSEPD